MVKDKIFIEREQGWQSWLTASLQPMWSVFHNFLTGQQQVLCPQLMEFLQILSD